MLHLYSTVLFAVLAANAVAVLLAAAIAIRVENATLEAEVDAQEGSSDPLLARRLVQC